MLGEPDKDMTLLFQQLGLDSSDEAIETFIAEHSLQQGDKLSNAPFWSESQRQFLQESIENDASWAIVVDELSVRLNEDA